MTGCARLPCADPLILSLSALSCALSFRTSSDIKLRLIDTQEPAAGSAANSAALGGAKGNVSVGGGAPKAGGGCC